MSSTDTVTPEAYFDEYPIKIRRLDVLGREYVTPKMVRLRLGGNQIEGFESHQADEHVKLVFPDPETGETRVPVRDGDHLDWPRPFPPTRDYTIRSYDREAGEIEIDFVVHNGGLASTWAQECEIGSHIWVAGPRPSLIVPEAFGFHVVVGDETALPAIGRWVEELPETVRAVVGIEIADDSEKQDLNAHDGVEIHWLVRQGKPAGSTPLMADFVSGVTLPKDTHTYLFAAGEAGCLKPIRTWAKANGVGKRQGDISGYWRVGKKMEVPTGLARVHAEVVHATKHLLRIDH